ncbi:MAG: tyrosine-type recombinase/integrase [Bacteroidota bacterium]
MRILFWIRKGRLNKRGQCPVMCRITLNGVRSTDFSTGVFTKPKDWNHLRQLSNDRFVNNTLLELKRSAEAFYLDAIMNGRDVHAQNIVDAITGKVSDEENLLKLFDRYLEHQAERKARTLKRYCQVKRELEAFLISKGTPALSGEKFTMSMAREITERFVERGCSNHHASRKLLVIRAVLQFGIQYGYIQNNPLFQWKGRHPPRKDIVALSQEQLQHLCKLAADSARIRRIADLFLFQCYTGLDYGCTQTFHPGEHLRRDPDGRVWLVKHRCKNGEKAFAPWLPEAAEILKRNGGQLPRISNQKYNAYLKELARIGGLDLRLTSHVGRKTFGMVMLNKGISIEAVSRMLGHRYITTTQRHYAQVLEDRVKLEYR